MHSDDSPPPSSESSGLPPIDPALEARLVAWILGEASAFEAAELARLCEENPAFAGFRRRLAEVHGLVSEAVRPAAAEHLRFAPERRAKLLAALGQAAPVDHPGKLSPLPAAVAASRRWTTWVLPAAACLALLGLLAAIVIPTVGTTFGVASKPASASPAEIAFKQKDEFRKATESTIAVSAPQTAGDFPAPLGFGGASLGGRGDDARVYFPRLDGAVDRETATPPPSAPSPSAAPVSAAKRLEAVASETRRRASVRGAAEKKESDSASLAAELNISLGSDKVFRDEAPASFSASGPQDAATAIPESTAASGAFAANGIQVVGQVTSPAEPLGDLAKNSSLDALKQKGRDQYVRGAIDEAEDTFRTAQTLGATDGETGYFLRRIADDKARGGALVLDKRNAGKIENASKAWQRPAVFTETETGAKADADVPKPAPRPAPDAALRLETPTSDNAVSTFSLHVADASFRLARAALSRGEFPDPAAIRPEEFYNAFDYGDPAPRAGEPVAARVEQAAHPFLQQRNLLRVALRVPASGRSAGQPLRLTLLLDTSGSMEREDRAATVRAALEQLATLLGPADRVTLVGFARTPRLLADRLPGDQAAALAKIAAGTPSEGGTNLDAALNLAADLALRQFDASAQNRVVLLTDGAANLGDADPAALSARVVQLRRQGVAFDACGVGANGLDDGVLEALTRQGDGRYLLLDSADEAGPAFARQLAGAFRPAAQNVKVQIRFNPSRVPRYRLIGFEQHRLREEDFRDDKVDAAELAAAEAAVALYQIEVDPQGSGELGEVFVRFRETSTGRMIERSWPLPYDAAAPSFDRASPSLQLAGASALLAEKLRGGDLAAQIRLADLDPAASALRGAYAGQPRVAEFLDMLAQARRLAPE